MPVELPKLPPMWYYEFRVGKGTGLYKEFILVLMNNGSKMAHQSIGITTGDSDEDVARLFDATLKDLAEKAWNMENPDSQWSVINSYRWAIEKLRDGK